MEKMFPMAGKNPGGRAGRGWGRAGGNGLTGGGGGGGATSRMGSVLAATSWRRSACTHTVIDDGGEILHQSPDSSIGNTGAPRWSVPTMSNSVPGPERTWMLLATTRASSTKTVLIQTPTLDGGDMAAHPPSVRDTNTMSPVGIPPSSGAVASGRE